VYTLEIMREKLLTPFLVRRGVLSLRKPLFHRFLGTLCFRCNRDQFLSFREESRMPSTIAGYQVVGDTHCNLFILAELDLKNEVGVEAGTIKKVLVPKRDMANGVVLPDRLRAVMTVDQNVCAQQGFVDFWAAPYLNGQRSGQFDSTCRFPPVVTRQVLHISPPQDYSQPCTRVSIKCKAERMETYFCCEVLLNTK
jgi:hypothetical protein